MHLCWFDECQRDVCWCDVCMRCSLTVFPLNIEDMSVTTAALIPSLLSAPLDPVGETPLVHNGRVIASTGTTSPMAMCPGLTCAQALHVLYLILPGLVF